MHLIQKYRPYSEDKNSVSINGGSMFSEAFVLNYKTPRCHNLEDHNMKLHPRGSLEYCVTQIYVQ